MPARFASLPALAASAAPPLLHAYWTLATGSVTSLALPFVPPRFKAAVRLASHRGKTWGPPGKDGHPLGKRVSAWSVPQRWFLHFYALGLATTTAVLAAYGRLALSEGSSSAWWSRSGNTSSQPLPPPAATAVAALAFLWLHLARRLAECAGLTKWPAGARMHGLAYVFSVSYYTVLPLSFLPEAAFAPLARAAADGVAWSTPPGGWRHAAATLAHRSAPTLAASPSALTGAALFAAGSAIQAWAHIALARLQAVAAAQGKPYTLPTGGILATVTCPHYTGEIFLYAGLALLSAGSPASTFRPLPWLVLAWVVCNLVLGAADADAWYRKAFGRAYPRGRARLVPGIW